MAELMRCPIPGCGQPMSLDPRNGYDPCTGLQGVRCGRCGHRGMHARDGVHLLFAGQHEYVFSYGPSLSSLKVMLSTPVLNLFSAHGVASIPLATSMVEWALLQGQVCGTVRPSGDLVLSGCYEYCRRQGRDKPAVSSW